MKSEKTKNIYQRISAIMEEIDYIQKGTAKVAGQYRFTSHDAVTGLIHMPLVKHGIVAVPSVKSLTQDGNRTSVCLSVAFVNIDDPKDLVEIESWGFGVDTSDKGPGKAVSYAFKYAILKMFCLETGDDPDEDQKSKYEPPVTRNTSEDENMERHISTLTIPQILEIERIIGPHKQVVANIIKEYEVTKLSEIPQSNYKTIINLLTGHEKA